MWNGLTKSKCETVDGKGCQFRYFVFTTWVHGVPHRAYRDAEGFGFDTQTLRELKNKITKLV